MYSFEIKPSLEKKLKRLKKRALAKFNYVRKKIAEIINDLQHYKNLKGSMKTFKRVHLFKSFVLIFSVNEIEKKIDFYDIDHHDRIYQ